MFEGISNAFSVISNVTVFGYFLLGCAIGFTFGIIPGLGSTLGLALILPFTASMEPLSAIYMYAGLIGTMSFAGSIPAILVRVPGTGINVASTFDGYPMTQRGEGIRALNISAVSSFFGAAFGLIVLILMMPLVRIIVMAIGPPEFFMLILWGLTATVVIARSNLIKGLISAGLGITFSLFGASPITVVSRWDFGLSYLQYSWGLPLIPFIIGLFAVGQMIKLSVQGNIIIENTEMNDQPDGFFRDFFNNLAKGIKEVFANKVTFIRSSIIGTLVGVIPGIGGSAATFLSYLVATITSNNPESFGKGNPVGLIATEAANDSKDGGALLTTLAFGIPGNMETAVLLGALMMHGITPGPLLVVEQPAIIWSLVFGLILANFIASTVGLLFSIKMSYLAKISTTYIIPVVITISIVSVYLYNRNIMDILVVIFAGFLSFGLEKHGYPLVPLAMGFILGRLGEIYYHQSLQMAWGSHLVFINRPISLILFMLIIFTFGMPVLRKWFNRKKATLR